MLASAVEEVLLSPAASLPSKLDTTMEMVMLHLGPAPTEPELEKMKEDKVATTARYATRLLAELKAGKPFVRTYSYPFQAWRLGGKQLLLTLGGEPVVDYALKFKKSFGPQTWDAGYCNDVMTYIASLRVLNEGKPPLKVPRWGYEGNHALIVYGLPAARWADDVEDLITASANRLVKRLP
jgi:neutral ceramidase